MISARSGPPRLSGPTSGSANRSDIRLPEPTVTPLRQISVRVLLALGFLAMAVLIVYLGRDGYRDAADDELNLIDCIYYATVSLTTTGYGDITPATDGTRLVNVIFVTPLRLGFLIVLVGTTLEVLATRSREQWRQMQWRRRLHNHTIVVGYGVKGRSAVDTLVNGGVSRDQIVVVDPSAEIVADANAHGFAAIVGDATRADVLRRVEIDSAHQILVTTDRDDTAVLITLTARQLNSKASIVVAVREGENVNLLRQSGADVVVTSSDAVGRLMGLATVSPELGTVLDDLLSYGEGLEVAERPILAREVGKSPRALDDICLAVVRDGQLHRFFEPTVSQLLRGDRLIVVRSAKELPWAPRPGGEGDTDTEADDEDDESGSSR
ncbi:potassium channel family protein [Flindersiella endophytica]